MWAYGLNTNHAQEPDQAEVYSWEGDFPTDHEAVEAARAEHGPDADLILAWVTRLTYGALINAGIPAMLAEMKERVAEAGGDTTCFDLLNDHDLTELQDEILAAVEVWEESLPEEKRSTAVQVRNRRRVPPA